MIVFNVTVQHVVTTSSIVPTQVAASQLVGCVMDVMTVLMSLTNGTAVSHISFSISHAGTVVPECYKDDDESQWKSLKFDPPPSKNA